MGEAKNISQKEKTLPVHVADDMAIMIGEIDGLYQQGVIAYAKGLHHYKQELLKKKNEIEAAKNEIKDDEKKLEVLAYEIEYDEKSLYKKHLEFLEKMKSIIELQDSYASLLEKSEYEKILKSKTEVIYNLEEELEELEIALLTKELQRINILETLRPLRLNIQKLEDTYAQSELDQKHFEAIALHQVSPVQSGKMKLLQKEKEAIDTEYVESE